LLKDDTTMRMYVIGNEDAVLGFSLVGVDGRAVRNASDLSATLDACLNDETVGLLLITADVSPWARERIDELKVTSTSPLVVEIPGENTGTRYDSLTDFVQRAMGIQLGGE
jgi:V/A-type H+-transporting ATPase subunit F